MCLCFVMHYFTSYFCKRLEGEEKAGCLALIVLHMSSYCKCSVAFVHGAMGLCTE